MNKKSLDVRIERVLKDKLLRSRKNRILTLIKEGKPKPIAAKEKRKLKKDLMAIAFKDIKPPIAKS